MYCQRQILMLEVPVDNIGKNMSVPRFGKKNHHFVAYFYYYLITRSYHPALSNPDPPRPAHPRPCCSGARDPPAGEPHWPLF